MFKDSNKVRIILQIKDDIEEHLDITNEQDFYQQIQHVQKVYGIENCPLNRIIKQEIFSVQNKSSENSHQKVKKSKNQLKESKKAKKKHLKKKSLQIMSQDIKQKFQNHKSKLSFSSLNKTFTTNNHRQQKNKKEINLYKKSLNNSQSTLNKTSKSNYFKRPNIRASLQNSIYSKIKIGQKMQNFDKENSKNHNQQNTSIVSSEKLSRDQIKILSKIFNKLDQHRIGLINFKDADLNCLSSSQLNMAQNHLLSMSYKSSKNFSLDEFLQLSKCV